MWLFLALAWAHLKQQNCSPAKTEVKWRTDGFILKKNKQQQPTNPWELECNFSFAHFKLGLDTRDFIRLYSEGILSKHFLLNAATAKLASSEDHQASDQENVGLNRHQPVPIT